MTSLVPSQKAPTARMTASFAAWSARMKEMWRDEDYRAHMVAKRRAVPKGHNTVRWTADMDAVILAAHEARLRGGERPPSWTKVARRIGVDPCTLTRRRRELGLPVGSRQGGAKVY